MLSLSVVTLRARQWCRRQARLPIQSAVLGSDYLLEPGSEKDALIQRISDVGLYAYETDPDEMDALASDRSAADAIFDALMIERLESWAIWLEKSSAAASRS